MKFETRFRVLQEWKVLLADMGINPADVLTLVGLPADLFVQSKAMLSRSADLYQSLQSEPQCYAAKTEHLQETR